MLKLINAQFNHESCCFMINDIVEESTFEWNFPVLLVSKKSGDKNVRHHRLVFEFRKLNDVTETQLFPMPGLEVEAAKIHGAKVFSVVDLHPAFNQIPLAVEHRPYTSFQTSSRKLQFKRMPFGLKGIISYAGTVESDLKNLMDTIRFKRLFTGVRGSSSPCVCAQKFG